MNTYLHGLKQLTFFILGINRCSDPTAILWRDIKCADCRYQIKGIFRRCEACGCLLIAKRAMADEHCPLDQW